MNNESDKANADGTRKVAIDSNLPWIPQEEYNREGLTELDDNGYVPIDKKFQTITLVGDYSHHNWDQEGPTTYTNIGSGGKPREYSDPSFLPQHLIEVIEEEEDIKKTGPYATSIPTYTDITLT